MQRIFLEGSRLRAWPWAPGISSSLDPLISGPHQMPPNDIADLLNVRTWAVTAAYSGSLAPGWTWSGSVPAGGFLSDNNGSQTMTQGWETLREAIEFRRFDDWFVPPGLPGSICQLAVNDDTVEEYLYRVGFILHAPRLAFDDPNTPVWVPSAWPTSVSGYFAFASNETSSGSDVADKIMWGDWEIHSEFGGGAGWTITVEPDELFEE